MRYLIQFRQAGGRAVVRMGVASPATKLHCDAGCIDRQRRRARWLLVHVVRHRMAPDTTYLGSHLLSDDELVIPR